MAGSYPDAPFRRMAWDEDGTIFVMWLTQTTTQSVGIFTNTIMPGTEYSIAQKGKFNNEATLTNADWIQFNANGDKIRVCTVIFPELRDVHGLNFWGKIAAGTRNAPIFVQYSSDSTNGISGTWTTAWATDYPLDNPTTGSNLSTVYTWDHWYRVGIVTSSPLPLVGVRALRWAWPANTNVLTAEAHFAHIHVYGDKSTGATPDRLLFIDNDTGLEFTAPLDWGDVPRGTTLTHEIKVKNNSATLTANTIVLDFEALTGPSDTWYTMSDSGGAFGGTLNITSIAPTASYPAANTITIKLTVGNAENLGLQASRLQASTVSWT